MAVGMPLGGGSRIDWSIHGDVRVAGGFVPMMGMSAGAVFLILGVLAREPIWIVACFALALGAVGMSEVPSGVAVELGGMARRELGGALQHRGQCRRAAGPVRDALGRGALGGAPRSPGRLDLAWSGSSSGSDRPGRTPAFCVGLVRLAAGKTTLRIRSA